MYIDTFEFEDKWGMGDGSDFGYGPGNGFGSGFDNWYGDGDINGDGYGEGYSKDIWDFKHFKYRI